jgi:hypothetical protein
MPTIHVERLAGFELAARGNRATSRRCHWSARLSAPAKDRRRTVPVQKPSQNSPISATDCRTWWLLSNYFRISSPGLRGSPTTTSIQSDSIHRTIHTALLNNNKTLFPTPFTFGYCYFQGLRLVNERRRQHSNAWTQDQNNSHYGLFAFLPHCSRSQSPSLSLKFT